MIPLMKKFRLLLWAMLWDENAARRQLRVLVSALAISGIAWAEQLEPVSHWLAVGVRVVSGLCGIVAAAHGDTVAAPAPASTDAGPTP